MEQIGSKLWFPRQPKPPIDLQWIKCCDGPKAFNFDRIFFKLAGNEDRHKIWDKIDLVDRIFFKLANKKDRHKISDELDFGDRIICFGVTCP